MPLNDNDSNAARLADAIERLIKAIERPPVGRLAYRADELAGVLGVGKRTIQREIAAGRFPAASRRLGTVPIWDASGIRDWLAQKGRP